MSDLDSTEWAGPPVWFGLMGVIVAHAGALDKGHDASLKV